MGAAMLRVIPFLPTIFPIVYAALMGKFFKALALYRAERGVTLGQLERLVGCQSLFGAISRQFALRQLDVLGVVILVLWCLSPIGGQSALRLLSTQPLQIMGNETTRYLPIEAASFTFMQGADAASEGWPSFAPIYMTALRTSRKQMASTMDLWGNVLIPDFALVAKSNQRQPTDTDWMTVSNNTTSFSSFIGIPVVGTPSNGNSTFNVVSRYNTIDCAASNITYISNYTDWNFNLTTSFSVVPTGIGGVFNLTSHQTFSLTSMMSDTMNNVSASQANCSIGVQDVESSVSCVGQNCKVQAMRLSTVPLKQRAPVNTIALMNSYGQWPFATVGVKSHAAAGSIEGSTPTEMWLADPNTNFSQIFDYVNLSAVPAQDLSYRIEVLWNTFWQSTFGTQYIVGGMTSNLSFYDAAPMSLARDSAAENITFNSSTAVVSRLDGDVYICHWKYSALVFLTSAILLAAGLATAFLRARTLAPDILTTAAALTRDNPFARSLGAWQTGSYADGLERARSMRQVSVVIGDVRADRDVGHIAFATLDQGPQRLRKGRLYD
jgi:hypothetical protein